MICPKCQSDSVEIVPAEIRLYRNTSRTLSYPPMTPSPDVSICMECGWSEFFISPKWLSAGWLRPLRTHVDLGVNAITTTTVAVLNS